MRADKVISEIILASASPRRKELLEQIHMEFQIVPSECEERIIGNVPGEIVQGLAKQKAEDVVKKLNIPGKIVLGADTVVAYKNNILGKPSDKEEAKYMISMLQGKEHQVYTGVCLSYLGLDGNIISKHFFEETSVIVYPMSEEEIDEYLEGNSVKKGEPKLEWKDKAGAYRGYKDCEDGTLIAIIYTDSVEVADMYEMKASL